jgi:hypothetical protein
MLAAWIVQVRHNLVAKSNGTALKDRATDPATPVRLQCLLEPGALFLHSRTRIDFAGYAQADRADLQYRANASGQLEVSDKQIRPPRRPRDLFLQLDACVFPGSRRDDSHLTWSGFASEVQSNARFRTYVGTLQCLHRRTLPVAPRDSRQSTHMPPL